MPKQNRLNTMFSFTVEGKHDFPFDMLRYDACFPASQEDAVAVGPYQRGEAYRTTRQVRLNSYVRPATAGRWESFGWKVVEEHTVNIG